MRLNNQVRRETRNGLKMKEKEIAKNVKSNPKIFWKYVQSKTRTKSRIPELYKDHERKVKTGSDKEKAEVLSEYFSKVFVNEPEGEVPSAPKKNACVLEGLEISEGKIRKVIQKLKKNKSPGPDELHPRIIKEAMEELIQPLKILYEYSFNHNKFPQDWRIANITAIFKKGDKCCPGNYRPVSLASIICKIMETLIREEIMNHMKKYKLFSKKQFGFISGRSTVLQLIKVLDKWTTAIDEGHAVDVVYCDFMKAFDRVPHRRLLEKISRYGIGEKYFKWIREFLTNREQCVVVNGEVSDWRPVSSGVPQGSVLGPLLFVFFINDLPECVKNNSEIILYADDTKIFRSIKCKNDCDLLQEDLKDLQAWTERWLLNFHPDKCKYMRIGRSDIEDPGYKFETQLERTTSEKDIGVIFNEKLNFSEHLAEKINKANKIVGIIRWSFVNLDIEIFRALYTALIRPHIEYANQIWSPHLIKDIDMIENVQRRASKLVPGLKHLEYAERLKKLGIPTLAYRRARGDLIEAFKILRGVYDEDCCSGDLQLSDNDAMRGNSMKLYKTRARLNIRKYALPCRVVNNWNALPEWVVSSVNVNQFEARLDKCWANQELKFNHRAHIVNHHTRQLNNDILELEPQA